MTNLTEIKEAEAMQRGFTNWESKGLRKEK